MTKFFDKIEDYMPGILVFLVWLILLPVRVAVLVIIPPGSRYHWHKLYPVFKFFRFEREA